MYNLQYAVLLNTDDDDTHIRFSFFYGSQPSRSADCQQICTYSVEHNTGSLKIELRLYTYATCFGPLSGHHQASLYKNIIKEDITR